MLIAVDCGSHSNGSYLRCLILYISKQSVNRLKRTLSFLQGIMNLIKKGDVGHEK